MSINVGTPYNIDRNTSVVIYPHRKDSKYGNYTATGKYYILKDTYDKEAGCRTSNIIENDLSLKDARNFVAKYLNSDKGKNSL